LLEGGQLFFVDSDASRQKHLRRYHRFFSLIRPTNRVTGALFAERRAHDKPH
jgi:hypothetical protein